VVCCNRALMPHLHRPLTAVTLGWIDTVRLVSRT
jgi:hypothetical protein